MIWLAKIAAGAAHVWRMLPLRTWLWIGAVLLAALLIAWYGQARYRAGEATADARWELAAERLVEQKREAALSADRAEAPRIEEHAAQVAEEKERIDAALEAGDSPFDVLFPERVR